MPCPAAGSISSGSKYLEILWVSPSLLRPAAASTSALYSPLSSFRSRVCTFPLTLLHSISGNNSRSCRVRLRLEQPMGFVLSSSVTPSGSTSTSLGSSLFEKARRGSSSGTSMGISFRLCTESSLLPSKSARSSSFTNSPFPPTLSRVRSRMISPVVFMVRSSAFSPSLFFSM